MGLGYKYSVNTSASAYSFIGGGCYNRIILHNCGVIGGGYGNTINVPGGNPQSASFIGAGYNNLIADSSCSSIVGGANNIVTGAYSSILGGSGNNDNGFAYAGIFGQNVNGVITNAFHSNTFVAQNMSPTAAVPAGTLYYQLVAPGCCAVYIS